VGRGEPLAGVAGKCSEGRIAGTSADVGVRSSITDKLTLTFPPKKTT
jgi:hypothetical protein